jgi:hypothetical protein
LCMVYKNVWEEAPSMSALCAVCVFALIVVCAILSIAAALGAILILAYRDLMQVLAALPAE